MMVEIIWRSELVMVWEKTKKLKKKMLEFTEKANHREYKSKWHYLGKRIRLYPSGLKKVNTKHKRNPKEKGKQIEVALSGTRKEK